MDAAAKARIIDHLSAALEEVRAAPTTDDTGGTQPEPTEPQPEPVEPEQPQPVEPEPQPEPPPAPTGLTAEVVEANKVALSWEAVEGLAWRLREAGSPGQVLPPNPLTEPRTTRGPLDTRKPYRYSLTAVREGVESARADFPEVRFPQPVVVEPEPVGPVNPDVGGEVAPGFRTPTHGGLTPVHPKVVRAARAGITFNARGGLTVSGNGEVIENQRITGVVTVNGSDVTFRNCEFIGTSGPDGLIIRNNGARLRLVGCLIDGQGRGHAIGYTSYTMEFCEVRNAAEGPRQNGNAVVRSCWIHHLKQVGNNHTDALQSLGGSGNKILGNFVELYNPASSNPFGNACVQFGTEAKGMPDFEIVGNYFDGGNYSLNGGGGGSRDSCGRIWGNRFGPANHTRFGGMMTHVERGCLDKQDNRRAHAGEFAYTL